MLYNILLVLIILDGLILGVVVLLQAGQGGGLASLGGGTADLVLGGRQAVTILHKASWVAGSVFMFLALLLSISASNRGAGTSSGVQQQLRQVPSQQATPTAPLQTTPPTGNATPSPAPVPPPPAPRPQ
jgi:preprotein translocase subunit SecG